jgi:hypothetical protein
MKRTSFCEAEGVRFSNEAVEKLAFQRQVQKFCYQTQYLHTSTKKKSAEAL